MVLASGGHSGYLAAAETLTPGMNHDWVDIDYRLPICCPCTHFKRMLKKYFFDFVRTYLSQFRKQLTASATLKELFERSVLHETRRIMHDFCFLVTCDTYWKVGSCDHVDEPSNSTKQRSLDLLFKESSVSCSWSSLYCISADLAIIIPRPADCTRLVKVTV